ncbi:hypothetical protein D3C85_880230 [compost metagenome]
MKTLKETPMRIVAHAGARIADGQNHAIEMRVESNGDSEPSALSGALQCILEEIGNSMSHAIRVCMNPSLRCLYVQLQRDPARRQSIPVVRSEFFQKGDEVKLDHLQ